MICPVCGSMNVAELDNLHSLWGCGYCGYQGDGSTFDPAEVEGLYSLALKNLMGTEWVEKAFPATGAVVPELDEGDEAALEAWERKSEAEYYGRVRWDEEDRPFVAV